MAEKVTKLPNQSNLISVITDQIKNTTDIIGVVVNAAVNSTVKISSSTIYQLKSYNEVVNTLFSSSGIVTNLIKVAESFQKLDTKKSNKENIDNGFKVLKMMQNHIKDFTSELKSFDKIDMPEINLNSVIQVIKELNTFKATIEKEDKSKSSLFVKFWLIKQEIKRTIKLITDISELTLNDDIANKAKLLVSNINAIYKDIVEIIENIGNIKSNLTGTFLLKRKILKRLTAVIDTIIELTKKLDDVKVSKTHITKLEKINLICNELTKISKKMLILALLSGPVVIATIFITFTFMPAIAVFISTLLLLSELIILVKPGIDNGVKAIASIVVSLLIIGAALVGFALLTPIFMQSINENVIPFVLASLALAILISFSFKLIGPLMTSSIPSILAFGLTIVILVTTLLASALIILIASKMTEMIQDNIVKVSLMIAGMLALTMVIVGLGLGIAAITPMIGTSLLGLGQILAIIGMVLGIGVTINVLAKKEIQSDEALKKTNQIVLTVNNIRTEIAALAGDEKEWRQQKRLVKQINRTVKTLTKIAKNLNTIQNIKLDQSLILSNVSAMFAFINVLDTSIASFLNPDAVTKDENGNVITVDRSLLEGKAKSRKKEMRQSKRVLNKVDRVIGKLNNIGESLISIGELKLTDDVKQLITSNLESIFGFITQLDTQINTFLNTPATNEEGNPLSREDILDAKKMRNKEWRKNKKILNKVEATIATIHGITETLNILKDFKFVEGKDGIKGTKNIIIDNVGIVMNTVKEIAGIVNGKNEDIKVNPNDIAKMQPLTDFIQSLNNGFKDLAASNETAVKNNIDNYIRLIDRLSIVDIESFNPISKHINDINSSIDSVGKINSKQFESNINNFVKFVDKVNTVDVTKLENSTNMFKQMAKFSKSIKGDFDKLADSLSEKLLPVLIELKDVMTSVPEELKVGFQNTSASIAATNAPATKENITAQVNRENSNLTASEVDKIVTNRMNEKAKSDANSVASKLDELIGLLKGYSGERVVVQTV